MATANARRTTQNPIYYSHWQSCRMPVPAPAPAALSPYRLPPKLSPSRAGCRRYAVRCESSPGRAASGGAGDEPPLKVGSPIVIVAAPPTLKSASSMPTLRINSGQVKPGDAGRIVARKPKDVWAVRLAIGVYLLDGKYFKPLDVEESGE